MIVIVVVVEGDSDDDDDDDVDECGGVGVDGVSDFGDFDVKILGNVLHCHHVCASVIDGRSEAAKWLCSIACLIRSISMSDVLRLQSLVYSPKTKPNIITSHNTHLFTILYVVPHRHIYNLHAFISST
ncbi:hypothetical protein KSF78_0004464 [Schistosoma japonicum]|nr:hypothetical protein KSF78_0004464 [Schistosoma japonicum]